MYAAACSSDKSQARSQIKYSREPNADRTLQLVRTSHAEYCELYNSKSKIALKDESSLMDAIIESSGHIYTHGLNKNPPTDTFRKVEVFIKTDWRCLIDVWSCINQQPV